jgi:hypothetical protein
VLVGAGASLVAGEAVAGAGVLRGEEERAREGSRETAGLGCHCGAKRALRPCPLHAHRPFVEMPRPPRLAQVSSNLAGKCFWVGEG